MLVDQLEPADVAAFVADALHQPDRVGAELFEVAVLLFATRNARDTMFVVLISHDWHPLLAQGLSLLAFFGASASGASG